MTRSVCTGRWAAVTAAVVAALSACSQHGTLARGGSTPPSTASTPVTSGSTAPTPATSTSSPANLPTTRSTATQTPLPASTPVCTPVTDWDRPADPELLDAGKMLGVELSEHQRAQSRDTLVDCSRPLTLHEMISTMPISVKGDPGPCYALGPTSTGDDQAAPTPTPYVVALCYPAK